MSITLPEKSVYISTSLQKELEVDGENIELKKDILYKIGSDIQFNTSKRLIEISELEEPMLDHNTKCLVDCFAEQLISLQVFYNYFF